MVRLNRLFISGTFVPDLVKALILISGDTFLMGVSYVNINLRYESNDLETLVVETVFHNGVVHRQEFPEVRGKDESGQN